jgi:prepilin-type N-terminal cleavage/methylation domain-containing protein
MNHSVGIEKRGFTLIELLVVISVIGMLASVVLVAISGVRQKAIVATGQALDSNIYRAQGDSILLKLDFDDCGAGCVTTAFDSSGYNNNGTLGSHATRVSPSFSGNGTAVSFDGTDAGGYVSVPYSSTYEPTQTVTLTAWFNPRAIASGAEQHLLSTTASGGWLLGFTGSGANGTCPAFNLCFFFYNPNVSAYTTIAYPDGSLQNNTWYFIAVSFDGATAKMYLNGKQVASLAQAGSIQYSVDLTVPLCIGNEAVSNGCSGNPFFGLMDSVRIYSRPITSYYLEREYLAELPGHLHPPLAKK